MPQFIINAANFTDYSFITPYIRYCAEDKYQNPWELKNRKIGDYEFVFITKGTGQFTIEGNVYKVGEKDLILIKPNVCHQAESTSVPFEFLCIHFDLYVSSIVNNVQADKQHVYETVPQKPVRFNKTVLELPEYITINDSSYMCTLLKKIIHEVREKREGFNTIIKSLFVDFLFNVFRSSNASFDCKKYPDEIQTMINFIQSNYMNRIYLSDLALHIHLQPTYVCRLFKKHTGYTISEFVTLHRLSVAKGLLLGTNKKIDEIAYRVGFYDLHHFSKVFKLQEGLSPSQYRQIKQY
jgi:AraC-like DNA-binding protein